MTDDQLRPEALLPLQSATFHILVALAEENLHGYAIIQRVTQRTGGEVRLSAGTLYRSIQRMLEQEIPHRSITHCRSNITERLACERTEKHEQEHAQQELQVEGCDVGRRRRSLS